MNSIVVKLGLSIIFLLLVVLFPLGYVVNQVFSNFYYQKEIEELNIQNMKLVQLITEGNDMAPGIVIAMQMVNNGVYILDSQKQVVIHANTDIDSQLIIQPIDWTRLNPVRLRKIKRFR